MACAPAWLSACSADDAIVLPGWQLALDALEQFLGRNPEHGMRGLIVGTALVDYDLLGRAVRPAVFECRWRRDERVVGRELQDLSDVFWYRETLVQIRDLPQLAPESTRVKREVDVFLLDPLQLVGDQFVNRHAHAVPTPAALADKGMARVSSQSNHPAYFFGHGRQAPMEPGDALIVGTAAHAVPNGDDAVCQTIDIHEHCGRQKRHTDDGPALVFGATNMATEGQSDALRTVDHVCGLGSGQRCPVEPVRRENVARVHQGRGVLFFRPARMATWKARRPVDELAIALAARDVDFSLNRQELVAGRLKPHPEHLGIDWFCDGFTDHLNADIIQCFTRYQCGLLLLWIYRGG